MPTLLEQNIIFVDPSTEPKQPAPDPDCLSTKEWTDWGYEYDCGYNTKLSCEDCKYGGHGGRRDPQAAYNQLY